MFGSPDVQTIPLTDKHKCGSRPPKFWSITPPPLEETMPTGFEVSTAGSPSYVPYVVGIWRIKDRKWLYRQQPTANWCEIWQKPPLLMHIFLMLGDIPPLETFPPMRHSPQLSQWLCHDDITITRALLPPRMADRTLFTSAHVEYLAAVIFYLLA